MRVLSDCGESWSELIAQAVTRIVISIDKQGIDRLRTDYDLISRVNCDDIRIERSHDATCVYEGISVAQLEEVWHL